MEDEAGRDHAPCGVTMCITTRKTRTLGLISFVEIALGVSLLKRRERPAPWPMDTNPMGEILTGTCS